MNSYFKLFGSSASIVCAAAVLVLLWGPVTSSEAQNDVFKGKTVTIIQGRDPGGTGDMRVRAMIPFLKKYLPGNPNIVMEYMPGGGSRKAAN